MAIAANYVASNQFSVASDKVARFVFGRRVLADCGTDGEQYGTVALVSGPTVTLTMDSGDALTANLVSVQHGNDIPSSLPGHAHTGPADGGALNLTDYVSAASTTAAGKVRLATTAEAEAGTDAGTAVTPAGLAAALAELPTSGGLSSVRVTGSTTLTVNTIHRCYLSAAATLTPPASPSDGDYFEVWDCGKTFDTYNASVTGIVTLDMVSRTAFVYDATTATWAMISQVEE